MSTTVLQTLQEYAKNNNLHKVKLSADGKSISLEDVDDIIDATIKHTVLDNELYSLASLFLLCKNPESLISYRKACKEYNIDDLVKASDRTNILGFFKLQQQQQQQQQQDDDIDMIDQSGSQKESKHHHDEKERRSKESKDKSRRSHGKKIKEEAQQQVNKKEKVPMTNEQVMQNLAIVAGKRGENRKVKADDVTMMQEMAHVTSDVVKEEDDPNPNPNPNSAKEYPSTSALTTATPNTATTSNSSNKDATLTDMNISTEESNESPEKQKILNALNAKGYEVNEELVNNDRTATNFIFSKEQPVGDSASILCFPSRDFTRVLELYLAVKKEEETSHRSTKSSSHSKKSKSKPQPPPSKKPKISSVKPLGAPIIIIPNAMTSPITMINAEEFFNTAKFTPRDIVMKNSGGSRTAKLSSLNITRNVSSRFGGGSITYEIIDNPKMKLKHSADWDRIVAVIPQGAEWQFKGWKYTQPVDIFSRTFGFYIGYEGAPVPKEVLNWNVKLNNVHRDKRGLDSVTFSNFWNSLDEWIAVHKPEYLPKDPTAL